MCFQVLFSQMEILKLRVVQRPTQGHTESQGQVRKEKEGLWILVRFSLP